MNVDTRALRPYAPLVVLIITIAVGWLAVIRPVSADRQGTRSKLASLRQREIALQRELSGQPPLGVDRDPEAAFERQLSSAPASPALLEQLARLAEDARARNLLIETVEGGPAAINAPASPAEAGRYGALQRDPRLALFDVPVSHAPIRVAFDTDYGSLGRFLWAFRNLPTVVEIRGLQIGLPTPKPGGDASVPRTDVLHVSLTLHAYARSAPPLVLASNTVTR